MIPPGADRPIILAKPVIKDTVMPKVWAGILLIFMGVSSTLGILFLRPNSDPVTVIGAVLACIMLAFGQFINYMKTEQTHNLVNSELADFKRVIVENARREGIATGVADEKLRVATAPGTVDPAK